MLPTTLCNCAWITAHSPGNKRASRLLPVITDGANAVICSEMIMPTLSEAALEG